MLLQTKVDIRKAPFEISPADRLLLVGSCFADAVGSRLRDSRFRAEVNPYGVMYNPASILHTVERLSARGERYDVAVLTLGTNHVYIEKETGEIVDNCQKRPQSLFEERELAVAECAEYIRDAVSLLRKDGRRVRVVLTVSPIRYAKYGFHGSRLSKAVLLLAADEVVRTTGEVSVFEAYEIMNDELRDYRFYAPDMLHPSAQAVEYIYEKFKDTYFAEDTIRMVEEWQPIKRALGHRPFNAESEEYRAFLAKAEENKQAFLKRWR